MIIIVKLTEILTNLSLEKVEIKGSFFTAPPKRVEIVGHQSNQKVMINTGSSLELKCKIHESKPVSKIVWYKNDQEVKIGKIFFITYSKILNNKYFM